MVAGEIIQKHFSTSHRRRPKVAFVVEKVTTEKKLTQQKKKLKGFFSAFHFLSSLRVFHCLCNTAQHME